MGTENDKIFKHQVGSYTLMVLPNTAIELLKGGLNYRVCVFGPQNNEVGDTVILSKDQHDTFIQQLENAAAAQDKIKIHKLLSTFFHDRGAKLADILYQEQGNQACSMQHRSPTLTASGELFC